MRIFITFLLTLFVTFGLLGCTSSSINEGNTPTPAITPTPTPASNAETTAIPFCDFLQQRLGAELILNYQNKLPIIDSIPALYAIPKEQIVGSAPPSRVYLWQSDDAYFGSLDNAVRLHGSRIVHVTTNTSAPTPPKVSLTDVLNCAGSPTHYFIWYFSGDVAPALNGELAKVLMLLYTEEDLTISLLIPHDIDPFTEQSDSAFFATEIYSAGDMEEILSDLNPELWTTKQQWSDTIPILEN